MQICHGWALGILLHVGQPPGSVVNVPDREVVRWVHQSELTQAVAHGRVEQAHLLDTAGRGHARVVTVGRVWPVRHAVRVNFANQHPARRRAAVVWHQQRGAPQCDLDEDRASRDDGGQLERGEGGR